MMKNLTCITLVLLFSLIVSINIEQKVLTEMKAHQKANIMIEMEDKIDFTNLQKKLDEMDWISRGRLVYKLLTEKAESTQQEVRKVLEKNNIKYTNLWIQNTISAKDVSQNLLLQLSLVKSIGKIWLDGEEIAKWETPDKVQPQIEKNEKIPEVGVSWIKAPEAWAKGYTGKGIILGTADSGTLWNHEALKSNYRGSNGTHHFNWYDPVAKRDQPTDDHGHGTHVQGSVTGSVARKIGVAPDAKWISCRIADRTFVPSNVIACWQFMLAPHDLNGRNANPDLRVHSCSHSYTCGTCPLDPSIAAHRASGIYIVVAAGNSGSRCSTHGYPAAHISTLSIGALSLRSDVIATFSSRGPGSNGIPKPAFALPGSSVLSSSRVGGYTSMSGTSMAAPHMNGAIGLLWSAVPELIGNYRDTEKAFQETALKQRSSECSSNGSPNNVYGYGTVNVDAAIKYAKEKFSKRK